MCGIGKHAATIAVVGLLAAGLAACTGGSTHEAVSPVAPGSSNVSTSPSSTSTPPANPRAVEAPPTHPAIAALGDSLSRGYDACSFYGDCTKASWITGTNTTVNSIATRLAAVTGEKVTVHNDARSGEPVADLARQVTLAIAQRPTIVTVLIGANDVCKSTIGQMTKTAPYAATVDTQLQRLSSALPGAHILVASLPNIENLLPVVGTNATAQFIWKNVGGCATALADPLSTSTGALQRRAAVTSRIEEYNAALGTACSAIAACTYDQGALFAYQPTIAQVTPLDYFHPSIAGLRELASTEWSILAPALGLPVGDDSSG